MQCMRYQVALKHIVQFGHPSPWFERPVPPVTTLAEAVEQFRNLSDSRRGNYIEIVVLLALDDRDPEGLNRAYEAYIHGRPYAAVTLTEDGIRQHIELAPLRPDEEYRYQPPIAMWRWHVPKEQLRSFIRLMGRVLQGELGGASDGLRQYGPDGRGA